MKLLQGASRRPLHRWLFVLPVALLLGSGLELQATPPPKPPSALLRWWRSLARHEVHVQTDDHGTLITESGRGGLDRTYQIAKDAEGHTHESYWEKGQAKPVDEAVRGWADTLIRESRRVPPVPPLPPPPPAPPAPPAPLAFQPGEAGQAALRRVENDARLIALVGTPMTLDARAKGSLSTWGPGEPQGLRFFSLKSGAKADLTLLLNGPKGSAILHAKGRRTGTEWTFSQLDVQPSPGGPQLNLLSN